MGEQEDIKPVDEQRGDSVDAPVLHREDDEGESGLREDLAALIDGATPSEIAPHLENEDAADAADALEAMEPGTTAAAGPYTLLLVPEAAPRAAPRLQAAP